MSILELISIVRALLEYPLTQWAVLFMCVLLLMRIDLKFELKSRERIIFRNSHRRSRLIKLQKR